jgi:translation elongation factor EF-1alpha
MVVCKILDIHHIQDRLSVLIGRVESGRIRRGDQLILESPSSRWPFVVRDFGPFQHRLTEVAEGDNAALVCDYIDFANLLGTDIATSTVTDDVTSLRVVSY